ncbi:glycine betaine/proline transport system substrate-binding protein [Modicisalibacter muralis]|uniref:Glycine betaine/proline transport system substrate-binding protein n=1 Tax=Modicisalibacter muralis TaxID=119000 RepID=A0A1G9KL14_9GAMM|nr:ABC transporter substrate-binding protein [Halomonas muralis]SDL50349.1 glycine betaine/proline transport system substrate-binding protein [Halomonas muralis]
MQIRIPLLLISLTCLPLAAQAQATDDATQVDFVVPPWPGITVKTEIVSQIIERLGYEANAQGMSSTVGYNTLQTGDSDVFLGGWLPSQRQSYDAAMEANAIVDLGNNVTGARMGFAVPGYVHDAGITSAKQLDDPENRERFDAEIYSIESGSTVSVALSEAMENDVYGLGDWEIKSSSTPGMLSEVDAAYRAERWIVFYGWTPHWMAPKYDMVILDDPQAVYGPDNGKSDVRTIVRREFSEANPNLMRLLDQLVFTAAQQSEFISEFSQKELDPEVVARQWIEAHPKRIEAFLEGVTTRDGQSVDELFQ